MAREGGSRLLSVGREEEIRRSISSRRDSMRSQEELDFEEGGRRRKERTGSTVQSIVRNLETGGSATAAGGNGGMQEASNNMEGRNEAVVVNEEEGMVHDVRTTLEGLNEFDFGAKMTLVGDSVRAGVKAILDRMEKDDLDLA